MRKLKLHVQMSIAEFVGGLNGELNYMPWETRHPFERYANNPTDSVNE